MKARKVETRIYVGFHWTVRKASNVAFQWRASKVIANNLVKKVLQERFQFGSYETYISCSIFQQLEKPAEAPPKEERKRCVENTYRMEPKVRFPEGKVRALIQEALDTLESHTYSASHSPFLAKLLSGRVLENVKQLNIERYKVVCLVTIGSKASQGLRLASRCLWNDQFDTFVSACFEGQEFFAVGTVYGVYFE
ncbi:hypothetical protein OS493_036093 [Desmophyllum pertusum]|uniref:Tctex1 domain-containing protein 1 n=1 Tax=Desmophyllum pertusum TaxID=174260 RepID=A0A9X0CHA1_9CNID|nr:hypothetical protein OS493_036093 [Desmophyllum pertusum]